jgi:hypothetical protein
MAITETIKKIFGKVLSIGTPPEKEVLYKEVIKRKVPKESAEALVIGDIKNSIKKIWTPADSVEFARGTENPPVKKAKKKKAVTKKSSTTKKSPSKKSTTKKTNTKTTGEKKSTTAKKTTIKKDAKAKSTTTTSKTTTAKKSADAKSTTKTSTTKKPITKKKSTSTKKTTATKSTIAAKKSTAKSTTAKKATSTKSVANTVTKTAEPKKTTATKKPVAKKTATKTTPKKSPTSKKTAAPKGSKRDEKIALYIKDIKKHYGEVDEAFVAIIVKNLGPSIYRRDAELVSCSDPKELDTVRKNFLIKKLGIDASQGVLDAAIQDVCTELKGVRTKYRATFYYSLAKKFKKESVLS